MSDNLFNKEEDENVENQENRLQQQIDELKNRGVDELAKGKAHADQFIEFLKQQNDELRKELEVRIDASKTLEEYKKGQENTAEEQVEDTNSRLSKEEIESLVKGVIDQKTLESTVLANQNTAGNKVREVYGEKAEEFMEQKSAELNLTREDMANIAGRSPSAFLNLVGLSDNAPSSNVAITKSSVNTESINQHQAGPKEGTWSYYETIRKENPSLYFSTSVQKRLFEDRKTKGEDFYK